MVTHLELPCRRWDGPKLPWVEEFGKGKGQVHSRDGSVPMRSCDEVEVAKRLRGIRDQTLWVSGYSPSQIPSLWPTWTIAPAEAPTWLGSLDTTIRSNTGVVSGGIPDVDAWNDDDPIGTAIFVECKGRTERLKEGQEHWVREALAQRLRPDQVLVAVRSSP